jgi:hypothetical protein
MNPIDAYLRELTGELRVPVWRRRRILAEVRAHLLEAAESERSTARDEQAAIARALARFGHAGQAASEFNRLARRRRALVRRALIPWIAAAALTSTASASVWAFEPGGTARHASKQTPAPRAQPAAPRHASPPAARAVHRGGRLHSAR